LPKLEELDCNGLKLLPSIPMPELKKLWKVVQVVLQDFIFSKLKELVCSVKKSYNFLRLVFKYCIAMLSENYMYTASSKLKLLDYTTSVHIYRSIIVFSVMVVHG
jgi:hypothetical protein